MQKKHILMCGILLSLNSCKSPEIASKTPVEGQSRQGLAEVKPPNMDVVLLQGRLKFQHVESFQRTVKMLNKGVNFDQWESGFPGYVSMRKEYKQLDKEDLGSLKRSATVAVKSGETGDSYERAITDDLLACIVNKDGLLQIGDTLYKVNDNQVMRTLARNEKELSKGASPVVEVGYVKNTRIPQSKGGNELAGIDVVDGYYEERYNFAGREHRFKANWWAKSYQLLGYWSCGYNITHQRRQTFGWGSSNAFNYGGDYEWFLCSAYPDGPCPYATYIAAASPVYESDFYQPFRESVTPYQPVRVLSTRAYWFATGRDGRQYGFDYPYLPIDIVL